MDEKNKVKKALQMEFEELLKSQLEIPEKFKNPTKIQLVILDLHGLTQDESFEKIQKLLSRENFVKAKIITGKSGILRKVVPVWLQNLMNCEYKIFEISESEIILKRITKKNL